MPIEHTVAMDKSGTAVYSSREVPEQERLDAMMGTSPVIAQSAAAAMLAETRARRGSLIETVEIDGQFWHLLRMNQFKLNEVGIRTVRGGDGTLLLSNADVFRALIIATLQTGVVKAKNDPTPFFNPVAYYMDDGFGNMVETTECEMFCDEPDFQLTVAELFDRLTNINKQIWPQKKKAVEMGEAMMRDLT